MNNNNNNKLFFNRGRILNSCSFEQAPILKPANQTRIKNTFLVLFSPKSMNLVLALCSFCPALKLICSLNVKLAVCQDCPNWLASVVYLQSAEGSVHKQAALEGQWPFLPETDISGLGKWGFLCSHKGLRKKNLLGQFQKEFSLG